LGKAFCRDVENGKGGKMCNRRKDVRGALHLSGNVKAKDLHYWKNEREKE